MLNEQYSVETEEKILKIVRAVSLIMKINTGNSILFFNHIFRLPLQTSTVADYDLDQISTVFISYAMSSTVVDVRYFADVI